MFLIARAVSYAALFIAAVLIFVPARVLSSAGVTRPALIGVWQIAGTMLVIGGAALVLSCIVAFVFIGRGTPAPFDPPRRLVVRGPYQVVRNPMYIGAGLALAGAALFYQSLALLGYIGVLFLITHVLVTAYEEPTLRSMFGTDYMSYCERTGRWWPRH